MPELDAKATVSIVVPFHNEEASLTELYARLHTVMEGTNWEYQFVFVDDGSTDHTFKLLSELAVIDPHVTIVRLGRNFGQTAALAAGFSHSKSEYVIAMDGDLQHNPAEIPKFLEKLEEGYDIVSGWRKHRIDNLWLRKIPSRCANWLMAKLSGVHIHDFGTTFKAYRRFLSYRSMERCTGSSRLWLPGINATLVTHQEVPAKPPPESEHQCGASRTVVGLRQAN